VVAALDHEHFAVGRLGTPGPSRKVLLSLAASPDATCLPAGRLHPQPGHTGQPERCYTSQPVAVAKPENTTMNQQRWVILIAAVLIAAGVGGIALRLAGLGWADWTALPPETHQTLAWLLILPAGALLTAFVRTIVGFQTFGTLTPTLLAASYLYCDRASGVVVFALVMVVGLGGRALLGRLRLQMGPRLGIILTVLVLCLAGAMAVMYRLGLSPRPAGAMMPLVVLTILLERFYVSIEENGLGASLRLLVATLAVAGACGGLLAWPAVGRLALAYPEAQLLVVAAMLGVGRYSGYRLTELWRFRELAEGPRR
jgi:hypothetical protein